MKKTKVVLALACAVLLVAASVMGTLAYLTSADKVVNTFTVGNVTFGGDDHKAGLDEALVNEKGQPIKSEDDTTVVEVQNAPRVQKNNYKLQPGHTYTKDPTIHVNSKSDDCYLFVKVENGIADIEAMTDTKANIKAVSDQMKANGWKELGTDYKDVWVYVGTETGATNPKAVEAGADQVVFEYFKVADEKSNNDLKNYENANITITAYGVQVDGFEGKDAVSIWNAAGFANMTVNPSTETKAPSTDPVESEEVTE